MALEWLTGKDKKDEKKDEQKDDEFELKPKEVAEKLKSIDTLKSSLDELQKKAPIFDRMATYLDKQEAAAAEEAKKKKQEKQAEVDSELEDEFLTDPANATKKLLSQSLSPLVVSQVNTAATLTMRDMFNEEPDYFEYAHDPTIRREVESMVTQLPLDKRTDKESIRNCYLVAEGRHKNEIKEGKIKARASAVSGSSNGTGGKSERQEETIVLSDAEKKAAKVFDMTDAEYAKSKKELSYV